MAFNSNESEAVYFRLLHERMRIDSSGEFTLGNPSGGSALQLDVSATGSDGVDIKGAYYTGSYGPMKFHTGGSERMRIDSSGNTTFKTSAGHLSVEALGGGSVKLNSNGSMGMNVASGFSYEIDVGGTEVVRIDSSGKVGIGTSSPNAGLEVLKSGGGKIRISETASRYVEILGYAEGTANGSTMAFQTIEAGTSTSTERMRIDSSGKVGIGETLPAAALHVKTSTNTPLLLESTIGSGGYAEFQLGASGATIGYLGSAGAIVTSGAVADLAVRSQANLTFATGGSTERVRIDSSGNVGIGTISPSNYSSYNTVTVGADTTGSILQLNGATSGHYHLVQNNNGAMLLSADAGNAVGSTIMLFQVDGSDAMRIDSNGNLLVGTTNANPTSSGVNDPGVELSDTGGVRSTVASNPAATFNRKTDDGAVVIFRKDGSTVGAISTYGGGLLLGNAASSAYANIRFTNNEVFPCTTTGGNNDDAIDLGKNSSRYRDIYAGNGTIQTSDRNEKQDIEELSEAEQRVAVACKGLLRKFRWKSSVEEKGDDARIHFGIIAQDLQDAFTAEGLDAGRYGMFINSTWTDEETGEERSRMGVRYSELLAFIIAAI